MTMVGAFMYWIASAGMSGRCRFSSFTLAINVGQSSGFGAIRAYSSCHGVPIIFSSFKFSIPASSLGINPLLL
jgi:hypothetical protein